LPLLSKFEGNHVGHEYKMEQSHYGGTCDCGNEDAWHRNGSLFL
jgi:hypothetical protein